MIMLSKSRKPLFTLFLILLLAMTLAACGGSKTTPEPTVAPPPTWTPTPTSVQLVNVDATPTPEPTAAPTQPPAPTPTPAPEQPTDTPPPPPTDTPAPVAKVIVTAPQANLRQGPSTSHPKAGVVKQGDEFVILGKNPAGDWWQIQVNGQPAWIYDNLVRTENADGVQVAEAIPTPPPAATQPPPPPPTATPKPAAPDPCANIGGDGCKWHLRGGPAFAPNTFGLKLTFGFVHGGRGDEPQGSYFVWVEKNGAKLPISDSVRSVAGDMRHGPNGPYNYEYSIGTGDLPDKNIAGCYTGWVLDGNGERDSHNFQFCVPEGQGEVWMLFDQS
jgi:hypothetical protein